MSAELKDLLGIRSSHLSALASAGIKTVSQYALASDTLAERIELAGSLKISQTLIYLWAKEAELLKCDGMDVTDAENLIDAGIRCCSDLMNVSVENLTTCFAEGKLYPKLSDTQLQSRVTAMARAAADVTSIFEPDSDDEVNTSLQLITTTVHNRKKATRKSTDATDITDINSLLPSGTPTLQSGFGAELSDILSNLGAGIAEAQLQMDQRSLQMHKQMAADSELSKYGIHETWFAIPEVSFSLKMEYSFQSEQEVTVNYNDQNGYESGVTGTKRVFRIVPKNANYSNTYSTTGSEESTLNIRFVPIPAPAELDSADIIDEDSVGESDSPIIDTDDVVIENITQDLESEFVQDTASEPETAEEPVNPASEPEAAEELVNPASEPEAAAEPVNPASEPETAEESKKILEARLISVKKGKKRNADSALASVLVKYMNITAKEAATKLNQLPMVVFSTTDLTEAQAVVKELESAGGNATITSNG